ncbi:MAG: hypothetical protein Fur0034_09500 [Desulfuromonadia bacterium]
MNVNIAIVSPEFPFSGRVPLVPPILEYLGALTLRECPEMGLSLIDANQRPISPDEIDAQAVAISVMTATAPWAYRFADACRRSGKRVILGGIHPTALPHEASAHADSVVIGEAESVWKNVLADLRRGSLAPFYRGERLPLQNLPRPIDGKLKGNYQFRAFFTMRGCPYRCTFCSVRRFFGDTIRYRPIPEVVEEIEACAGSLWFNGDDNIWGGDINRSIQLFNALAAGTKRHWYGFGDLRSIQGPQGERMLSAARRSGLFSVWVGWENDEERLSVFNAGGKQGADRIGAIRRMQDAGVDVTLFVVLGAREDSIESFKRTLELSERLGVGIHPVLLTPLPGTELYEAYRDYLIPGLGWEAFTGVRSVFTHPSPDMTPERREEEYHRLTHELFRFERIVSRLRRISSKGFPSTHLYSLMMQLPMKHALSRAYGEWRTDYLSRGVPLSGASTPPPPELPTVQAPRQEQMGWFILIILLTLVDMTELLFFPESPVVDIVEAILFLNSAILLLHLLIVSRKILYRAIDTFIDWSADGGNKRRILVRGVMMSLLYGGGELWGGICLLQH